MQMLIRVLNHQSTDVDKLNEYLTSGWEVVNSITFSHGTHFLIKKSQNSTVTPKVIYSIQLDRPEIKIGSTIITKDNTAYTITTF